MKRTLFLVAGLGVGWCLSPSAHAQPQLPLEPAPVVPAPGARADESYELLTRGPVHEAFAQAALPATDEHLVVKKEPPAIIDEIPPAQRPAGNDIAWIPGYWGWDDERNDYIWISGIWRAIPPGREWIPGYWARVTGGYQWISGYWADIAATELDYLPAPPETVDAGPSTQSPTGDEIWIPGTWVWQQNKYMWRAGYWAKGDPRWVWTNAHYVYTPRGYIYVAGYWDFLPQQRGVLYSPVYFNGPVARNYIYSPRLVVNSGLLMDHLFLRPTYGHYYYGDYYGAPYRGHGILPYYMFNNSRYGYDSLYAYQRWHNRTDRNWERNVQARYDDLRDREAGRPPRDWATWERRNRDADRNPFFSSIQDYSRGPGSTWKFRDLNDDHRRDVGRMSHDLDTYRQQRLKTEAEATAKVGEGRDPDRVRVLKPPITETPRAAVPGDKPGRNDRDVIQGREDRDDRPRLDREPNRITPPRPEPRDLTPDAPKGPRVNPPVPRETPQPRPETPRVDTPRPETPKVDPRPQPDPRPKADPRPKVDPPKSAPMPRPEPRPQPAPQPPPKLDRPERGPGPGAGLGPGAGPGPGRPQVGDRPNKGKRD